VEQTAISICQHHWVLTEPHNDVIDAVCKRCRARREYPARLETTERFDDYQELTMGGSRPLSTIYGPLDEEQ
jgi:hypothetical protein